MIVAQLECTIKQTLHVDLLADDLISRRGLSFMNEVAATKLFGSQTDSLSNFVQMSLQRKDALRRPESPERPVRWHVRRDCLALNADMRAEVRPGSVNSSA